MATKKDAVQTQNTTPVKQTAKSLFSQDNVKAKFQELMGKKSIGFITSVLQCTSQNAQLATADPNSILQAAMIAATLDLPINNNLGFAYIIPYGTKDGVDEHGRDKYKQVAQFQLGYKGFLQLAQRSGQFKTISATPIYEGQISANNPLTGYEFDFSVQSDVVVGYAAYFKLLNGFEKTLYMTIKELNAHGSRFSKTFGYSSSLWKKDFPGMATKTVLKLLLSKYAPLSIEMQLSVKADQGVINDAETEDITYIDNEPLLIVDKEAERITLMIQDATSVTDLELLKDHVTEANADLYNQKLTDLSNV